MKRIMFLSLFVVVFSACTPFIMVSAKRDVSFDVDRNYPIYLNLDNDVSIDQKNTYNLIKGALVNSQFRVVDSLGGARLVLTFAVSQTQRVMRSLDTWPYYYGPWPYYYDPFWYPTYPRVYVTNDLAIRLRLFDAQSFRAGKRIPLWEGSVYGDTGDIRNRLQESLNFLVDKIGTDFYGGVKISNGK